MQFNLLGPLEVVDENGREVPLSGITQRATLALLLLHANKVVATSHLLRALWGDDPPLTARKMLQNAVCGLRRVLQDAASDSPSVALLTQVPGYLLKVDASAVDLLRFEEMVEAGRADLAAGAGEAATRRLREALALWRGPVLADLAETGIAWPELTMLRDARLSALEDCVDSELAAGRHEEVVRELEAAVAETDPPRERLCGQLILALYRCGRQAEALSVYRRTRDSLVAELGLDPGRALQELERRILDHDPLLSAPAPVRAGTPYLLSGGIEPAGQPPAWPPATPAESAGRPAPHARLPSGRPAVPQPAQGPVAAKPDIRVERKRISVLLVGVQNRVPADRQDPEDVNEALVRLTTTIREVADAFGGVVSGAVGSVWLVLFGVPRTREDDPERAVTAGKAIRDQLANRSAVGFPGAGTRLIPKVAVASGEALVTYDSSNVDSPPREVSGAVLDMCRRLLEQTPGDQVWICDDTHQASDHAFVYVPTTGPVIGWELTAVHPERRCGHAALPFVGRDREMARLAGLLDDVRERGRPYLLTLLGEPGIGKSRLVAEAADEAADKVRFLVGRCVPDTRLDPFGPLTAILRQFAGIDGGETGEAAARRLADALDALPCPAETTEWLKRELVPLVRLDRAGYRPDDPAETVRAWARTIEEIAAGTPLMVALESLQWADEHVLDMIETTAEWAGPVPLLMVATARPELLQRRPFWAGGMRSAATLAVDPLPDSATAQLLGEALVGRTALALYDDYPAGEHRLADHPARQSVSTQVGGNPMFVSEYIRMFAGDTPHGPGSNPTTRVSTVDPSDPWDRPVSLPNTVYAVIAARLDTLPPEEKAVLQDAAVFGETVWAEAVAVLSGRTRSAVASCLENLARRDFLRRGRGRSPNGESHFEFRHVLVRDVAYAQLPRAIRADKHYHAAILVERLGHSHGTLLAHHCHRALALATAAGRSTSALAERARRALTRVGRDAIAQADWQAALCCFATALDMCPAGDPDRPGLLRAYRQALQGRDSPRATVRPRLPAGAFHELTADASSTAR